MAGNAFFIIINPLRPNSDLSQTFHFNIKGFSVSEVMRIENMITQVKFYWYFNYFCKKCKETKGEFVVWYQGLKG